MGKGFLSRRLIHLIILAAALMALALPLACLSEEESRHVLDITLTMKPSAMVEPGDATLTFTITNTGEADAENVTISSFDGLQSEPIGQIAAGESQSVSRAHTVTQEELDEGAISFIISHDSATDGQSKVNYTVRAAISRSDPQPDAEFTRRVSASGVASGDTITVAYTVRNIGNVSISGVVVRDSLGEFTGRVETLAVGESHTFISRVTMTADGTSAPEMSYTVPAKNNEGVTRTLDAAAVRVVEEALSATLTVGQASAEADTAEALVMITSTGGGAWTDITVTDDALGGLVADGLALPENGEPLMVSHTYALRGETAFRWRVTGISASGQRAEVVTDTVTIRPAAEKAGALLSVRAQADTPEIGRAGPVRFSVTLANEGDQQAENVVLYETTTGETHTFTVVPAGTAIRRNFTFEVKQDAEYVFNAAWTNEAGVDQAAQSESVAVKIVSGAPDPDLAEGDAHGFTGAFTRMGETSTYMVMLICAGAVLLALISVLLFRSVRARKERKSRIAAQKQRQKEEMNKTARFTPIRRGRNRNRTE